MCVCALKCVSTSVFLCQHLNPFAVIGNNSTFSHSFLWKFSTSDFSSKKLLHLFVFVLIKCHENSGHKHTYVTHRHKYRYKYIDIYKDIIKRIDVDCGIFEEQTY